MKIIETKGDEPLKIKGYTTHHLFDIKNDDGTINRVWIHTRKSWWIALLVFAAITIYKIHIGDFVF